MTAVTFTVPGKPAPQGSKRHVGKGRMVESSQSLGPWRERVAIAAHNAMENRPLIDGAVTMRIMFVLPRPKNTPKTFTPRAIKRPDLDKLVRAVLDAVTDTILADDSQVVGLRADKRLAELGEPPHAQIGVQPLPPNGRIITKPEQAGTL